MSQVGPDAAISNLSEWYSVITKLSAPNWLKDPHIDFWWTVAFSIFSILSLLLWWWIRREKNNIFWISLNQRIYWDFSGALGMVGQAEGAAIFVCGFQAKGINKSSKTIGDLNGHIQSLITGEKFNVFLVANGVPVKPEETNGIPPKSEFLISAPFHHQQNPMGDGTYMPLNIFERNLAEFEFIFFANGKMFSRVFRKAETQFLVNKFRETLIGDISPKVTLKDH